MWSLKKVIGFFLVSLSSIRHVLCFDVCVLSTGLESVKYYRLRNTSSVSTCNCTEKCVPKCCALGYYYRKGRCVKLGGENVDFNLELFNGDKSIGYINNASFFTFGIQQHCKDRHRIPNEYNNSPFFIQENGKLYLSNDLGYMDSKTYCVDRTIQEKSLFVLICLEDRKQEQEIHYYLKNVGMIISMPFLLATFIVYALLPERNLHMKALMSYVFTLMLAYILLVTIQMHPTFPSVPCRVMGYSCLFFFIVSFYWMNVICIDIWLAFSGVRGYSGRKSSERKRFLYYCMYAWGMSILHVLVVLIIDLSAKPNAFYHPGIGSGQCFLKNRYPELLYLYFPVGLLICINIAMFALTAYKIRKVKQDTKMLKKNESQKHSYENDKQRFNLYLKLLLAMGVNWSMEIISWAVNWHLGYESVYAWYATDFCNAAYGVVIFFIFVFKRSIWKMLQKRYYSFIGKPHLAHSNTTTQTRSTSYSTAATTVHEMHPTSMGASERLMDH